ncbi:MFS transporter [Jiella mangrovi]|uniref:MFS transporter n=1 Tax=Jiella mangrovi TaxID=2821407 RepID=A0ABS4BEV3_9HYPH|nr:MFS transporter [Jiella mangrovi]MBP0615284.1 MFS transporter [Jiella mangrovi]
MQFLDDLKSLDRDQRHTVAASYLGWTLDAFDFFILVFVLKDIAKEFATGIPAVALAITLTLAARPVGALIFGLAADRYGRRPVLMLNVLSYSVLEFASGFSTSLTMLIILRTLYGVAMGGEWGVGASLTMESVPPKARGIVSGLLQAGYPSGYLLASLIFFFLYPVIGWRGMFMVGVLPALLVLYIRQSVKESPDFVARTHAKERPSFGAVLKGNLMLVVWAVLLMTAFNFFSHGTQDLYPTFLEVQRGYDSHVTGAIAIFFNVGAILGGLFFGALSQRIGRKNAIVIAAVLVIPASWLWVYAPGAILLAIGAFLVQFFVQGAWGVVPAHLNELSPPAVRGTFPGVVYQLGNLIASANATMQTGLAAHWNNDYGFVLIAEIIVVAIAVAALAGFGYDRSNRSFAGEGLGAAEKPAREGVVGSAAE